MTRAERLTMYCLIKCAILLVLNMSSCQHYDGWRIAYILLIFRNAQFQIPPKHAIAWLFFPYIPKEWTFLKQSQSILVMSKCECKLIFLQNELILTINQSLWVMYGLFMKPRVSCEVWWMTPSKTWVIPNVRSMRHPRFHDHILQL